MMIDFTRDFCLPCQVMAPSVAELAREHAGRVDVVEVNIDREHNQGYGRFFAIDAVPTQVWVDADGGIVARHAGLASKQEMQQMFEQLAWVP